MLEVFRLNGNLLAAGDRLGAGLGLTSARWQVMGALAEGARTVPQIARAMGLTRQAAQRTVNVLRDEGLVARSANPDHKRARLVALTDEGRYRLAQVSERQVRWADAIGESIPVADLATTLTVVRALRVALDQR